MKSDIVFTADRLKRFEKLVAKYETPRSALLPTLYLAQEQWGFLTPPVMAYVASLLKISPAQVTEAVSFYTMFKKEKRGKWCLQICQNITCHMMGAEKVLEAAKRVLGVEVGQNTEDGKFSLLTVECIGACDKAPVAQINERYFENLDPVRIEKVLRELSEATSANSEASI